MILRGKTISPGVARGVSHVVGVRTLLDSASRVPPHGPPETELERLYAAIALAGAQLARLIRQLGRRSAREDTFIFDTHASILNDPQFIGQIQQEIKDQGLSAEAAIARVARRLAALFANSTTPLVYEKAADILDIGRRLVQCLAAPTAAEPELDGPAVVVANELTPSELVRLAHQGAVAAVTEACGNKSHTAILARGMGLPLITDIRGAAGLIPEGAEVFVDAARGIAIFAPTEEERPLVDEIQARLGPATQQEACPCNPPVTTDGHRMKVLLNISDPAEAAAARQLGADGVGLFRTEFLYMDRSWWPSEADNLLAYRQVAAALGDAELNLRLADFGAEKSPPYADIPINRNPSLGLRGIRLLLQREDILRPQIRAITQLAAERPLTVLLPMIDTLDTLDRATNRICEMTGRGCVGDLPFRVGAMIELPSAALMIDEILARVDSVSIGLNDLTQYTLAADRDDELVESYHDALQPVVLRLVRRIIAAADQHGKPVTICGELAGDPALTGLLLALGLRRLSVSRTSYPGVVSAVGRLSLADAISWTDELLSLTTGASVREFIADRVREGD